MLWKQSSGGRSGGQSVIENILAYAKAKEQGQL
jgi:hypothetical protein